MPPTDQDPCWLDRPLPAEWNVSRALDRYLFENGFTREAYDAPWTPAEVFGLSLRVPNTRAHRWALMRHDLHHVVTGYGTDLAGEGEVSAWEAAAGLPHIGLYTQGIVRSLALWGLVTRTARTRAAWSASGGRNLFLDAIPYASALAMTVGALREALCVPVGGLVGARRLHSAAPVGEGSADS
jgi:hypothetical protein